MKQSQVSYFPQNAIKKLCEKLCDLEVSKFQSVCSCRFEIQKESSNATTLVVVNCVVHRLLIRWFFWWTSHNEIYLRLEGAVTDIENIAVLGSYLRLYSGF